MDDIWIPCICNIFSLMRSLWLLVLRPCLIAVDEKLVRCWSGLGHTLLLQPGHTLWLTVSQEPNEMWGRQLFHKKKKGGVERSGQTIGENINYISPCPLNTNSYNFKRPSTSCLSNECINKVTFTPKRSNTESHPVITPSSCPGSDLWVIYTPRTSR